MIPNYIHCPRNTAPRNTAQEYLEDARKVVAFALEEINAEMLSDAEEIKTAVRQALRRFCKKTIERRPVILPVILEM